MTPPTMSSMLAPSKAATPSMKSGDPRIGHLLGRNLTDGRTPKAVLLGFESDEGVKRNGGREGARRAPDAIREALFAFTPDAEQPVAFTRLIEQMQDIGNVVLSGDLEKDQESLGNVVANYLAAGSIVIIIGGGHETSYGHFLGYVNNATRVSLLSWDAHPDVRELVNGKGHSGSPFRQAILHPSRCCVDYRVGGVLPYSANVEHLKFIKENGGHYFFKDRLDFGTIENLYRRFNYPVMASFDVDAVDASFAPGVSAPASFGMYPEVWFSAAEQAGSCERVRSIDIVEVNPDVDLDRRAIKLAALTIWYFLRGMCHRRG
ncbi:MAG: formimidoylglutamase [Bdellovibrionota bacterium]|nr:MAG: formimidoylglutamase [Bdellovibrionota bacterium]